VTLPTGEFMPPHASEAIPSLRKQDRQSAAKEGVRGLQPSILCMLSRVLAEDEGHERRM